MGDATLAGNALKICVNLRNLRIELRILGLCGRIDQLLSFAGFTHQHCRVEIFQSARFPL
jgi:hypothetical protein